MKMTKLLLLCLGLWILDFGPWTGHAVAGTAIITILDGQGNSIPDMRCVLTFFSAPQSQNGGTAIQWRNSAETDTNGQITLTNAAPGNWQVKPLGLNLVGFTFLMPVTNGTIRAEDWITASAGNTLPPDTVSFGVHASDRRYLFTYAGTNGVSVSQSNNTVIISGAGLEPSGTTAAALAALSTIVTDTNLSSDGLGDLSAGSLTVTGVVNAASIGGSGTNQFYNVNGSGALDQLYAAGFGYGQNGWVEIITNLITGAGQLVTVPPSPVGLYTAEISGRGGVLSYFATVSNTNYVTLAGAGTAIANGVYTWNGTAYSNVVTSCWITNAGSSAAYLLHAGTNLYHSIQFFSQMQPPMSASFSPIWLTSTFSGKQFFGAAPGPVSYPLVTLDFNLNNCLATNLQYNSMTALATNTPVPISAHLVGTNVIWTSP